MAGKVAEIQAFTGTIAAAVEEIAADGIRHNVALAAEASEKVSTSTSEVLETAGQTKQEAASVSRVSTQLSDVSSQLSAALGQFTAAILGELAAQKYFGTADVLDAPAQESARRSRSGHSTPQ